MTDINYMDDYEDNPIIESDIREVLDEFNLNQSHPLEVNFFVDRHELGDGKHRVVIGDDEIILNVNGWTTRETFKEDLRTSLNELKIIRTSLNELKIIRTSLKVEAKAEELRQKLLKVLNGGSPDTKQPNGLIGLIKNQILIFERDNKEYLRSL